MPTFYGFILKSNSSIPKLFKNKKKEIGIRIPDHNIPRQIVKELGNPIVTTSIKNDDKVLQYITDPELIHKYLGNKVDLVISDGFGSNTPSTIIKFTNNIIEIIREGKGDINLFL